MTDKSIPLPTGGGSYIRLPDGRLKLDEEPTAREARPDTPVEDTVEAPVKRPVKEA